MSLGLSAQDSSGGFASELNLVPQPQSISPQGAPWRLPPSLYLHLPTSPLPGIRARAQIAVGQLEDLGMRTQLMASETLEPNQALLTNSPTVPRAWIKVGRPLRGAARKPEGYRLTIRDDGALIEASDENGFYYAAQTIQQLLENRQDMPGLVIEDGPLLPHRAVHLDFKGWPPTRSYLETTLDRLSHYRFNIVILEYEDYFLYNSQPGLSHPKALPPNYIVEIDTLAKERGITLVPLLHGLGNVGYILKLDPYRELREDPRYLQMFCPSHPSTLEIFTAMVEDLLACHSAPLFHIGGDPARFLGQCPACQARARQLGGARRCTSTTSGRPRGI
ncbi:MAG: beta-N-acetylhexosaminidase [Planctomycetota bacterium]|nr:beta-N-acetylhexosaminidase [Planctomycetota bacterium]